MLNQVTIKKRANLQSLRETMKLSLKSVLSARDASPEFSQKFSENSHFVFEQFYRLGDKVGEGAHGVVKKVHEIQTGTLLAVKILQADEEKMSMIKDNFLVCRPIKHQSIIQHHQLFLDRKNEQAFLIMEYCPFPSLQSIYRESIELTEIAHIMKLLLEAVCELHKNGVCHRDLKLQNILYERSSGNVKIIDLGISKLIVNKKTGEKEKMWSVTGTLNCKAPEMLEGTQYDEKIDAWALGVIAYQLSYGRVPFDSEYESGLIRDILTKEPEFESSEDSEDNLLINFIQGLLRKNPERRMNCFEALHHPFIQHSQSRTKKWRYKDLFHLDEFSSKISRSRSVEKAVALLEQGDAEILKQKRIKELKQSLISDCIINC